MPWQTPSFWSQKYHPAALALWPIGKVYQAVTEYKIDHAKLPRAQIPVLCIGNATAGGVGKTPIVQDIAARLLAMGFPAHILLRGYGGLGLEATRVDATIHDAFDVGDEALLHAGVAPTWVGANRYASAEVAANAGAKIAIMDDGLQNTSILPSARWLVVNANGIGNGYGIPAGPMRESWQHAIKRADALIIVEIGTPSPQRGEDVPKGQVRGQNKVPPHPVFDHLLPVGEKELKVLRVSVKTDEATIAPIKDKQIYAFAGIGQPERLRMSLMAAGLDVVGARAFPDHHPYSAKEIEALHRRAKLLGAALVTTQKDYVRLPEALRAGITPVDVKVIWQDEALLNQLLQQVAHAVV